MPFGKLDGKDLSGFLLGTETKTPHQTMFHYCGEELAAIRLDGRFKVVYTTPIWDEGYDSCPSSSICGCSGSSVNTHDPPLIFDLDHDIAEASPLGPSFPRSDLVARAQYEKQRHLETLQYGTQPNQMNLHQRLDLLPCCTESICQCDLDSNDTYSQFYH